MTRPITASMLYDMVTCPHRVTMDVHADAAGREPPNPFLNLLWERGQAHEAEMVRALGIDVADLSALPPEQREQATDEAMAAAAPLIYGGRISVDDLVGQPDLLRLDEGGYVAGDIKSGAGEEAGKPRRSYAMQLALYTDILERRDLAAGRSAFIIDGHGDEVDYELDAPRGPRSALTLWQEYTRLLARARAAVASADATRPAWSSACKLCTWRSACLERLQRENDLSLLPEVGRSTRDVLSAHFDDIAALADADVDTLPDLARSVEGVGAGMLVRLHERARLRMSPDPRPYRRGDIVLPEGLREVFFDVEVDPLRDCCYLHGFLERDPADSGSTRYLSFFAAEASEDAEEEAFAQAWEYLRSLGEVALYHYGPYERTTWRALQDRFPHVCDRDELDALFADETTIDLYTSVIRSRTEWPTRDFSIKTIAGHLGFAWRDEDPSGASSIEWFESWLESGDPAVRARILAYNEDDCRATAVVLDGVRALEPE